MSTSYPVMNERRKSNQGPLTSSFLVLRNTVDHISAFQSRLLSAGEISDLAGAKHSPTDLDLVRLSSELLTSATMVSAICYSGPSQEAVGLTLMRATGP